MLGGRVAAVGTRALDADDGALGRDPGMLGAQPCVAVVGEHALVAVRGSAHPPWRVHAGAAGAGTL
ncbi:MAG: hypothetical protein QOF04_766 [Solirubrobacteraceae bacterium]|nr:hypothetical protein [Solirubrobacteraceae bacterium]